MYSVLSVRDNFVDSILFSSLTISMTCTSVAPNILQSNLSTVRVRLGGDVKIKCQCLLCMPLTAHDWFFEEHQSDQNIYIEQQLTMGEIGNNSAVLTLEIINATVSNAGEYVCRLWNVYGYDEMVIRVEVLSPPQIEDLTIENPLRLNDEEVVVVEGSLSHMKCVVNGDPLPVVYWWKDGQRMIDDGRM